MEKSFLIFFVFLSIVFAQDLLRLGRSASDQISSTQCLPCNGTCCDEATENCCNDPENGGVCCISETTFCCAPGNGYPSRCCPRWYVCCYGGRYGCCQPETEKPMGSTNAYAIYTDAGTDVYSIQIDMTTGDFTSIPVSGFNDWGEITRVFVFDPSNILFYLPQTNFSNAIHSLQRPITLYTIDPQKGTTTIKTIQGAVQYGMHDIPGFDFHEPTGKLILSTEITDANGKNLGYNFYSVDPTTAIATQISSYNDNSTGDLFVGWFDVISLDGNTAYRLGYRDVVNQLDFGLQITDISQSPATTKFYNNIPVPSNLGDYMSFNLYGNYFISLAPDDFGDLSWNLHGPATVLAELEDGYNTPYFGPIIEYINVEQSQYGALVVWDSVISDLDRWVLVVTNLPGGNTEEYVLWPWVLAQINSVSSLGFA